MRLAANLIELFADLLHRKKFLVHHHGMRAVFLVTILVSRTYIDGMQSYIIRSHCRMNCLLYAYIPVVSSSINRVELLGSGTA